MERWLALLLTPLPTEEAPFTDYEYEWPCSESNLDSHDIAFEVTGDDNGKDSMFRAILLSGNEGWSPQRTRERIERLRLVSGGRRLAVIFLLDGEDAEDTFAKLQCSYVSAPAPARRPEDGEAGDGLTLNTGPACLYL